MPACSTMTSTIGPKGLCDQMPTTSRVPEAVPTPSIDRDIRFSADKSPYKTFIAARVGASGYVQLNARALGVGAGLWEAAPDQIERYRRAVDDPLSGEALERIVARVRGAGNDVLSHGALKTAPKGFPKDHPRIGLLRLKGLAAWREWPAGPWLGTPEPTQRLARFFADTVPLVDWLDEHVGPSAMPGRGR